MGRAEGEAEGEAVAKAMDEAVDGVVGDLHPHRAQLRAHNEDWIALEQPEGGVAEQNVGGVAERAGRREARLVVEAARVTERGAAEIECARKLLFTTAQRRAVSYLLHTTYGLLPTTHDLKEG